jgi:hypothetical protein
MAGNKLILTGNKIQLKGNKLRVGGTGEACCTCPSACGCPPNSCAYVKLRYHSATPPYTLQFTEVYWVSLASCGGVAPSCIYNAAGNYYAGSEGRAVYSEGNFFLLSDFGFPDTAIGDGGTCSGGEFIPGWLGTPLATVIVGSCDDMPDLSPCPSTLPADPSPYP